MTVGKMKKGLIILAMIMSIPFGLKGADYNQTENFGVKKPGDKVGFTVTPPGTVLTGNVTNPGGFVWTGGPATWNGTIPGDFSGQHSGTFDGTYQPAKGKAGKGDSEVKKTYTWHVDTNARVCTYFNVKIENKKDAQDGVTWKHEDDIIPHSFSVPCTKDKIFGLVKENAAWESEGKKVLGLFVHKYNYKDVPKREFIAGLSECPKCKNKTLYRYQIIPNLKFDSASHIEIASWEEYVAGGASGPGPEARLAWREFYAHISWHENTHKTDYGKYIDKVKKLTKEYNSKIIIGEACFNAFGNGAKKKAMDEAEKKYKENYTALGVELKKLDDEYDTISAAFDANETASPGESNAPLKTIGNPNIFEGLRTTKRWEEAIDIGFSKEKGYQYYQAQMTKKWTLNIAPSWLSISDNGKLTGTPLPSTKPAGYKADGSFKFTVKYEETLDGETIKGELNYTLIVKSWMPVIVNINNTNTECKFTVQDGTGIPISKSPSYLWSGISKGGIPILAQNKTTSVFTIIINGKKWQTSTVATKKSIKAELQQTGGGVTVKASSSEFYYEKTK